MKTIDQLKQWLFDRGKPTAHISPASEGLCSLYELHEERLRALEKAIHDIRYKDAVE